MRRIVAAWLFLFPVTAAMGGYFLRVPVGNVSLFGFRLLVLSGAIALVSSGRISLPRLHTVSGRFVIAGYIWVMWAAASMFWTPALAAGLVETLAVAFGATLLIVVSNFVREGVDASAVVRSGWVAAYVVAATVTAWELLTGNHLPGSFMRRLPHYALTPWVTTSLFDNPNNYAAFLILAFPLLYWQVLVSKRRLRPLYGALLLTLPFILVLTGGRLAMLTLVGQCAVILVWTLKTSGQRHLLRRVVLLGLGAAALSVIVVFALGVDPGTVKKILILLNGPSAVARRFNLTLDGLVFFAKSYGLGVGAGGFTYLLAAGRGSYSTAFLVDPHNMWIEILAQYGLVVMVPFLWALGHAFLLGLRASFADRSVEANSGLDGRILVLFIFGYVFAAIENSTYITQSVNWAALGTIVVIGESIRRRYRAKADLRQSPLVRTPESEEVQGDA